VCVEALVTAGLSNARRAGDPAECRDFGEAPQTAGTINTIIITNARLADAAMVEAVLTATEAKTAVLQQLGARSLSSGKLATGTGTDAIAIVSGDGPPEIHFCGKHVVFGEMIACAVMQAIEDSLKGERSDG